MKLKTLAAVLGIVGSMAASSYAWAATYYQLDDYYSDAAHTTWVGQKEVTCRNKVTVIGTVTIYRQRIDYYNCAYPIP